MGRFHRAPQGTRRMRRAVAGGLGAAPASMTPPTEGRIMPKEARGDDVYQPQDDGQDPPNDDLDLENALGGRGLDDQMEEGYSPPERLLAVDKYGTTGEEERRGESLDQRLAQEVDDVE